MEMTKIEKKICKLFIKKQRFTATVLKRLYSAKDNIDGMTGEQKVAIIQQSITDRITASEMDRKISKLIKKAYHGKSTEKVEDKTEVESN